MLDVRQRWYLANVSHVNVIIEEFEVLNIQACNVRPW